MKANTKYSFIGMMLFILLPLAMTAQINMGGIKSKAADKVKSAGKEAVTPPSNSGGGSSSGSNSGSNSGSEESGPITWKDKARVSPAKDAIWNFHSAMSSAKESISKGSNYAEKDLNTCAKHLETIKQQDPKWSELEQDEADLQALRNRYEMGNSRSKFSEQLFSMKLKLGSLDDEPWKYKDYIKALDIQAYAQLKADIQAKHAGEEDLKKDVDAVDARYASVTPKVKVEALKDLAEEFEPSNYWSKERRATSEFREHFAIGNRPTGALKQLDKCVELAGLLPTFLGNDADVAAYITKCQDRKADIEQYMASGQLEKMEAELIQEEIDARRLGKSVSTEAAVISYVKSHVAEFEKGTLQRVVIVTNWWVSKNDVGLPKYKYAEVEAAIKRADGKCYKLYFDVRRQYEGGGNYGPMYMEDTNPAEEMNCANVNK